MFYSNIYIYNRDTSWSGKLAWPGLVQVNSDYVISRLGLQSLSRIILYVHSTCIVNLCACVHVCMWVCVYMQFVSNGIGNDDMVKYKCTCKMLVQIQKNESCMHCTRTTHTHHTYILQTCIQYKYCRCILYFINMAFYCVFQFILRIQYVQHLVNTKNLLYKSTHKNKRLYLSFIHNNFAVARYSNI